MTTTIPFLQYLQPHGRMRQGAVEIDGDWQCLLDDMNEVGWRCEAEILTTGEVSLAVFDTQTEVDIDIEVIPNGPGVKEAVTKLLTRTRQRLPAPETR